MDNDINQNGDFVNRNIDEIINDISGEFNQVDTNSLKTGIEKIIDQNDILSSKEETNYLANIIAGDSKKTPEVQVSALKTKLAIDSWQKENITEVRKYRANKFRVSFVKKTEEKNPGLTEEKIGLVNEKAKLITAVDGKIETQKDLAFNNNEESIGKIHNSWSDLKEMVGLLSMKPKEVDKIVSTNKKINAGLEGVVLPYEDFSRARSFDKIMASDEILNTIKSAPKRLGFINKGIMKVREFSGNGQGVVQFADNFVSKIGNQPVNNFVKNSMETLLQNDFQSGTKAIISGLRGTGLKTSIGNISLDSGTIGGPANLATSVGNYIKKSTADGLTKLGLGAKNFLANNFGKIGGSLVKGLNTVVSLPTKLIGSIGTKMVAPALICFFLFFFGLSILQINSNISGLVPKRDNVVGGGSGSLEHGEITILPDGRVGSCGVGMKTDFGRNRHVDHISPSGLGSVDSYNKELENYIGDNYKKRCGVVYAAEYLANKFRYWVPYYRNGKHESKGLNPEWGKRRDPDVGDRDREGLDCSGFTHWAYINGNGQTTDASRVIPFSVQNCDNIRLFIQPGDTMTLDNEESGGYHAAIILEYDSSYIKFAHAGGGSGVTTGLIDICTGKLKDGNMQFEYIHRENISQ